MKKLLLSIIFTVLSILFVCFLFTSTPVFGADKVFGEQADVGPAYVPGELLVKYKAHVRAATAEFYQTNFSIMTIKVFDPIGVHHVKLPEGMTVEAALAIYQDDPNVEYAEPNYYYHINAVPNDPDFEELWGLHNTGQLGGTNNADIDAPEAWDISTGSPTVIIAVIDTGVDYNHEDLFPNMWVNTAELNGTGGFDDDGNGYVDDIYGWDARNDDGDPMDGHSHGTHCAGTIGAVGDNSIGVVGVNWAVRIMALKFLSDSGGGDGADAITCIEYAIEMGAHIMNNSWDGEPFSQALEDAITDAHEAGILFVAAAGNGGTNNDDVPHYPASYEVPNVLAVAATNRNDRLADFSNYGATSVDVAAPGEDIWSTVPNNSYDSFNGTSTAAPHVAGLAGLIKAQNPSFTDAEIKNIIMDSIDVMEYNLVTGGRVNAFRALSGSPPPPPSNGDGGGGCFMTTTFD